MPCPIGTLPIVEPYHFSSGSTKPGLSPGKSMPVFLPYPNFSIQLIRDALPSCLAIVTAPTFDECDRISEVVSHSVGRYSASWITRSATWIEYGSLNFDDGVT